MTETGVDFDYGDEGVLAERGEIVAQADGCVLKVGEMTYDRVVVGGCLAIRKSTFELLNRFHDGGGELLFVGGAPTYVEGAPVHSCRKLALEARHIAFKRGALLGYFEGVGKMASIENERARADFYIRVRECQEGRFIMLLNHSERTTWRDLKVRLADCDAVERWDCFSGACQPVAVRDGAVTLDFAPGQECVLFVRRGNALVCEDESARFRERQVLLPRAMRYSLDEPNVCVLDRGALWADGELISEMDEVLALDAQLRDRLGIQHRGGDMLQPWAMPAEQAKLSRIRLRFGFEIEALPDAPVMLAMEPMDGMKITVNGQTEAMTETEAFWVDSCFRVYEVAPNALCAGNNAIGIEADYSAASGLESVYLLGAFGVWFRKTGVTLGKLPRVLRPGSLVLQGMPFYGGKVNYRVELPELPDEGILSLSLPRVGGSCAVAVYGGEAQMIPWPWRAAEWPIKPGEREIEIQAVLNRRNTFGPLHRFPLKQPYVAPDSFVCDDLNRYALHPTGLLKAPILTVKEEAYG